MNGADLTVFILQQAIIRRIPLRIVALGGVFSERSGIINLALDGERIFGAFAGAIFVKLRIEKAGWTVANKGVARYQLRFVLARLVAALAGALMSLLLSFAAIKRKADQTIVGTALNVLAPAIVCAFGLLFFHQEKIDSGGSFALLSSSYPKGFGEAVENSHILSFFFNKVYISTYLVLIVFVLRSIWLYKSKIGRHLRACGENPQAADSVGINVYRRRYLGSTISGALAGLGGFAYIATVAGSTADSTVNGLGFLALAIRIFGNWNPLLIAFGAFFFGFLNSLGVLAPMIPFRKEWGLPMYFYNRVPYLVVILVLILFHGKSGCPKAEGIPYDKGQR